MNWFTKQDYVLIEVRSFNILNLGSIGDMFDRFDPN